jgi:DNA-binding response OmpR family regulator
MKVLVVDRETFLAELVKLALEADGNECFTAASVDAASHVLGSARFDLIVVDLATDEPKSLAWLEETILGRSHLRGRAFLLSGRPLEEAEARRVRACGARVLPKPFTLRQVRDAVRETVPVATRRVRYRPRGPTIRT